MSRKLLLIGGGGHCKTVIEAAESMNSYDEIAIIDIAEKKGKKVLCYPVVGTDDELLYYKNKGFQNAFISIGSIDQPIKRIESYKKIKELDFNIPVITHVSSEISRYATIQEGTLIGKKVVINADSRIGICSILNSGCIIEHDCEIGNFSHIAPGSVLSGNVSIGYETHIGANSVIRQGINVGSKSIIGMGSVVLNDIEDRSLAYGNPCRKVERL